MDIIILSDKLEQAQQQFIFEDQVTEEISDSPECLFISVLFNLP